MSNVIERARALRATIEQLATNLDEATALDNVELFKHWSANASYSSGERIAYNGKLYRVLQTHNAQEDWNPENAKSLFAEILPGQDGTDIGEWVQPDSTNPYKTGDKVTFNGNTYESVIDGNVWSPSAYPAGWKLIE